MSDVCEAAGPRRPLAVPNHRKGEQSHEQDIKNAGAEFVDQEVVEDGNLISSRNPDDVPAFTQAALARL